MEYIFGTPKQKVSEHWYTILKVRTGKTPGKKKRKSKRGGEKEGEGP